MLNSIKFKFTLWSVIVNIAVSAVLYLVFNLFLTGLGFNKEFLIIFVTICVTNVGITLYYTIYVSKTVKKITQQVGKITNGEIEEVVFPKGDASEIADLSNAISKMSTINSFSIESAKAEKGKIETLLKYITDGIIAFNLDGTVMQINDSAKKMLGIKKEITFESLFIEKLKYQNIEMEKFSLIDSTETRTAIIGDIKLNIQFIPFKNEQNRFAGIITIIHDTSEEESANNLRHELVANVSHEINTPLTIIRGFAEDLLDSLPDKDKKDVEIIITETDRLSRMAKDLITLSKLANSNIEKEYIELDTIVKEIIKTLGSQATRGRQELTYSSSSSPIIYANADKIKQVLINVIGNALKYSPTGSGKIQVFVGEFGNQAYVKVQDNGFGIANKELKNIFDRFYRIDKARSRSKGGSGLGLAIAKEIMSLHNGDIEVTSKLGQGTKFTILLPLASV